MNKLEVEIATGGGGETGKAIHLRLGREGEHGMLNYCSSGANTDTDATLANEPARAQYLLASKQSSSMASANMDITSRMSCS